MSSSLPSLHQRQKKSASNQKKSDKQKHQIFCLILIFSNLSSWSSGDALFTDCIDSITNTFHQATSGWRLKTLPFRTVNKPFQRRFCHSCIILKCSDFLYVPAKHYCWIMDLSNTVLVYGDTTSKSTWHTTLLLIKCKHVLRNNKPTMLSDWLLATLQSCKEQHEMVCALKPIFI